MGRPVQMTVASLRKSLKNNEGTPENRASLRCQSQFTKFFKDSKKRGLAP
ncbi:hypothetical protein HMPREF9176_2114 [Streptococcus downei F0415]|nr:hypothetical protein HMPREF9176_2114 [Streptococcus downei F0415]